MREQLKRRDLAACVLVDSVNLRYATGARNMQVFHLRNPARYLFVPTEGPVVLLEFPGCHHLAEGLETIDEIRPAFAAAGPRIDDKAKLWAAEIGDLIRQHGGGNRRVPLDRVNHAAAAAPAAQGFEISNAQHPIERARAIKTREELVCIRRSIAAVERAVADMLGELQPGMTLCIESYIGAENSPEGVKLEEQVLVTENGVEPLSRSPPRRGAPRPGGVTRLAVLGPHWRDRRGGLPARLAGAGASP